MSDRTIAGMELETAPPRRRWVKPALAAFLAFELGAAALLFRGDGARRASSPEPRASSTARTNASRAAAERAEDVTALLDRRARAIRTRDRVAFAATLDPSQTAFRTKQLAMFDALAQVPLSAWRYELDPDDAREPTRYGAEAWSPAVRLRYALAGFDDSPTAVPQYFTFVRRGTGWLTASDSDTDSENDRRTGRELWDFGPVTVVKGTKSLVLGHPGQTTLLRDVARLADAAVPRVTRVWGTAWSQEVVVIVPSTAPEITAILGDGTDLTRIAAVAVAELNGDTENPVGNRVIVNPTNFRRLGNNGRRVVLTHETTHVATRDASTPGTPTWLVEGFADYVGYLGTGLSARAICQELAADVRAGKAPRTLPADTEFDGGNERLAQAYEASWLAVRLIVERVGQDGLVDFYRAAGANQPSPDAVRDAMRDTLNTTPETFTAAWREYVVDTLG